MHTDSIALPHTPSPLFSWLQGPTEGSITASAELGMLYWQQAGAEEMDAGC